VKSKACGIRASPKVYGFWLGWFAKKLRLLACLVRQEFTAFGLLGSPRAYGFWLAWFAKSLRLLAWLARRAWPGKLRKYALFD